MSDKPRWEKDIEPLVETAAWNSEKTVALNPGTARKFARDFLIRRQAAYSRYRVSIPGRVEPEHRGELDKVNGAGAGAPKKLNVLAQMPAVPNHLRDLNRRGVSANNGIWRFARAVNET